MSLGSEVVGTPPIPRLAGATGKISEGDRNGSPGPGRVLAPTRGCVVFDEWFHLACVVFDE